MANLSLSIIEIIVLMLGAITLGITIHFFITSRKGMKSSPMETEKVSKTLEEWKLRYFNDTEIRDKELTDLRKRLEEAKEKFVHAWGTLGSKHTTENCTTNR